MMKRRREEVPATVSAHRPKLLAHVLTARSSDVLELGEFCQ